MGDAELPEVRIGQDLEPSDGPRPATSDCSVPVGVGVRSDAAGDKRHHTAATATSSSSPTSTTATIRPR